jgi:hypothetical protein
VHILLSMGTQSSSASQLHAEIPITSNETSTTLVVRILMFLARLSFPHPSGIESHR